MNDVAVRVKQLKSQFDEKAQKKLKLQMLLNLCNKLKEDVEPTIKKQVDETYVLLLSYSRDQESKPKEFKKSFALLRKEVRKLLGYTYEGQIREEYTSIGIAIGTAIGTSFVAINPAFIGIGIPIGLAIGVSIGTTKEKEAKEQGKVY